MTQIKKLTILLILLLVSLLSAGGCIADEEPQQKEIVEGVQFDGWSNYPSLSPDGRYVAYVIAGDYIPTLYQVRSPGDILIFDRETKETVSVRNSSGLGLLYSSFTHPTLSNDGRYVAFEAIVPSEKNPYLNKDPVSHQIYLFDRLTGEARCVSVSSDGAYGNARSNNPYITPDGHFITFSSWADNLVEGDTNGMEDIFVHDSITGVTERISVSSDGEQGNAGSFSPWLSSDGRWAVFGSGADNLVLGDQNEKSDIFLYDRKIGEISSISIFPGYAVPSVSPIISGDGNRIAFRSYPDHLPPNQAYPTNIYLRNRQSEIIDLITYYPEGTKQSGWSRPPAISEDGRFVAFESYGALTPGDTNGFIDIWVYDRETNVTALISLASDGTQGNAGSYSPDISFDGRYVTFVSEADNLVEGDINGYTDIFVHDRVTRRTTLVSTII
jgi:Tol biopolymer transport system component